MSTDTPTPERVTLTHDEHLDLGRALIEALRTKESAHVREAVETILAAREQALREEIARDLEREAEQRLGGNSAPTVAQQDAADLLRYVARRIARGGAR